MMTAEETRLPPTLDALKRVDLKYSSLSDYAHNSSFDVFDKAGVFTPFFRDLCSRGYNKYVLSSAKCICFCLADYLDLA